MSFSDGELVTLHIEPATPLTEVSVSDARFRKIALKSNTGAQELRLPRGVYEVSFRDGRSIEQKMAVLSADARQKVVVRQEPQIVPTDDLDTLEPIDIQDHPQIVVIVRDPRENNPGLSGTASSPPASRIAGLSLRTEDGATVSPDQPAERESYTKLPFSAPPGRYRLRLQTGLGDRMIEVPIVGCPGWNTRISSRLRPYGKDQYGVDVGTMQVRMYAGSRRRNPEERALERNALALLAGSRTLSGAAFTGVLRGLMAQKYGNPMFGLYAGHLLRGADADEIRLIGELVSNLQILVANGPDQQLAPPAGFAHPDVEALKLRLQSLRGERPEVVPTFPFPPMLFASWQTILQAAMSSKKIIPENSLSDRIANHLVGAGAYMAWSLPPEPTTAAAVEYGALGSGQNVRRPRGAASGPNRRVAPAVAQDHVTRDEPWTQDGLTIIAVALRDQRLRDWFRLACGIDVSAKQEQISPDERWSLISEAEQAVAQAVHPVAPNEKFQRVFEDLRLAQGAEHTNPAPTELASRLRLPVTTVDRAIRGIARKLAEQAQLLGIDVQGRATMAQPELIIPYDPHFLGDGFVVPIPSLSDTLRPSAFSDGAVLDYTHYSLIMHAPRRVAIVTAHNVDAARSVRVTGGLTWQLDERAGENQLGPDVYHGNQLDKGHLVRREDVLWGTVPEAKLANRATFFYTNAAPQHKNFNQDEWVTLEDWILDKATDFSYRLCVFTGPVLRSNDPVLDDLPPDLRRAFPVRGQAQIPAAFWKVVVLRDADVAGEDLSVVCFAMRQSEMWNDRHGRRLLHLKLHQVTLQAIEEWTGLDFGDLRNADELAWSEERTRAVSAGAQPEWPLVQRGADIVYSGPSRRLRGLRAVRGPEGGQPRATGNRMRERVAPELRVAQGCGCSDVSFDARAAVESLSREVTRLTEVVAAQARAPEGLAEAEPLAGTPPARTRRSGGVRALQPAAESVAEDDERVQRMVAAAPENMRDAMRDFARTVTTQFDVARGAIAVPPPSELERIVGGSRVQAGAIPSCVCIGDSTQWFCTGVIVAPQVVLTAAHCGAQITRILVGDEVKPSLKGRIVAVRQAVLHPSYRRHPLNENDINVLILAAPAATPPVPIATAAQLAQAAEVHLVGFGYDDPQLPKGFGIKREVRVPIGALKRSDADDLSRLERLTGFHAAYEFVAGRKGLGKDSCNGDSGGPAYIDTGTGPVVAGLTSRATADANVNCGAGGIYVRPDAFRDWINTVLTANGLSPLP